MSDEAAVVDTGISTETHQKVSGELAEAQKQIALLKARHDIYDSQKREALTGMKDDVSSFITDIASSAEFAAFKHELAPMCRWAGEMESGEALDTNLSIGRLVSCASAKFKRTREEASQLGEKSTLLSNTMKELEELKADRDGKASRICELEGLVDERTSAATKLQEELAKAGLMKDKARRCLPTYLHTHHSMSLSAYPPLNVFACLFADRLLPALRSREHRRGRRVRCVHQRPACQRSGRAHGVHVRWPIQRRPQDRPIWYAAPLPRQCGWL